MIDILVKLVLKPIVWINAHYHKDRGRKMYGDKQYCNKYGCDWVIHHHVEDEYMGELTVYECKRCGARQAKWCQTWKGGKQ